MVAPAPLVIPVPSVIRRNRDKAVINKESLWQLFCLTVQKIKW